MKKNIAIIMGGYSSEVEISLKSGQVVYQNISKEKYNTYKVHILKDKWVLVDDLENEFPINKHDFSTKINGEKINFDCVFNAIHGHPGEDGTILAYFELIGLKHTSAPFYQMALAFNKRDCLSVVKQYGIKTAKSYFLNKGDNIKVEEIIAKVGLPCFVKPNNAGSSFGISKAKTTSEMIPAIEKAFKEDSQILIEEFLDGPEITIGVIEYKGKIKVLPMTEIVSENEFFDYDAKYLGKSQEITPARISPEIHKKLEKTASHVYQILNMSGFSRSEYILVNGEPYFLELNTVPGLTSASLIPQQAEAAGITLEEIFHNAIEMALNKNS
ncbi:D-alanine--D-alanine ligase [Lutibacter sp.]|uniref:D-alanine--D-alanine ligase n=1 Tax=Lutibacter sp. TaxID=1925666 RepID=UPI0035658EDD